MTTSYAVRQMSNKVLTERSQLNKAEDTLTSNLSVPENDDKNSATFLLAEYERLKDVHTETGRRAFRRFEFYLTITSVALGAYLVITQTQKSMSIPQYLVDVGALFFLAYGVFTFINLTYSSIVSSQLLHDSLDIQNYFINRDPSIRKYLYSRTLTKSEKTLKSEKTFRFFRVLTPGTGASDKSVIAFINSMLSTYLLVSLLKNYLVIQFSDFGIIVIAIIAFISSGLLHALCVTLGYRIMKR